MDLLEWRREVDRTLKQLRQRTAKLIIRPSSSAGGGGGGGSGVVGAGWHLAPSKAELPSEVAITDFGLVTAGPENGRRYYRDAANASWLCWTHLE